MKTLFLLASAIFLLAACNKTVPVSDGWRELNDSVYQISYGTYLVDLDDDGADDVQFRINSSTSPGGWNEGWLDMIMLNTGMKVNTVSVTDTFCLDTIDHGTYDTYFYHNCGSTNFYEKKDFTYAPVHSRTALEALSISDNTTDTVHIYYYDYSTPAGSYPGTESASAYQGAFLDAGERYFLFENSLGGRFGLGIRTENFYIIFTRVGGI